MIFACLSNQHFHCVHLFAAAVSRKRYVKEKLFNQMLSELSTQQWAKPDVNEPSTEYSAKFGTSKPAEHQVNDEKNIPLCNCLNSLAFVQERPADHFKLNGANACGISFWNTVAANGRRHFKQFHPLTKLNSECLDEAWR